MTVEVRTYKKCELERIEKKAADTIKKQTDKYIPIHIYNNMGNISKAGYQLRYIKREDIDNYIKEQDKIEHKWSKKQQKELKKKEQEGWKKLEGILSDILNEQARKDGLID